MKIINIIISAVTMATVTVSGIFIPEVLCKKIPGEAGVVLAFLYLFLIALIYTAVLISENKKIGLIKCLLSLPFSYLCLNYFWKTHFSIRVLNWPLNAYEVYGSQSAGGNFNGFFMTISMLGLCAIGIVVAMIMSRPKMKRFSLPQVIAGAIITVANIAIVLYLESLLPSWDLVNTYINS